jgi:hypothetical protein
VVARHCSRTREEHQFIGADCSPIANGIIEGRRIEGCGREVPGGRGRRLAEGPGFGVETDVKS